mgnify:CR=1 FL=1
MPNIHHHKILILDFGSQYTQLIARRVREIGVYCELVPYDVSSHFIENYKPSGIILSGGPDSVNDEKSARASNIVFDLEVPILGICYGMQTMDVQLGGDATSAKKAEFGFSQIRARNHSKLLAGIHDEVNAEGHASAGIDTPIGDIDSEAEGHAGAYVEAHAGVEGHAEIGEHGVDVGGGAMAGAGAGVEAGGSASAAGFSTDASVGASVGVQAGIEGSGHATVNDGVVSVGVDGEVAVLLLSLIHI